MLKALHWRFLLKSVLISFNSQLISLTRQKLNNLSLEQREMSQKRKAIKNFFLIKQKFILDIVQTLSLTQIPHQQPPKNFATINIINFSSYKVKNIFITTNQTFAPMEMKNISYLPLSLYLLVLRKCNNSAIIFLSSVPAKKAPSAI